MLRHSCLPFAIASMQEMHLQSEFYQSLVKKKTTSEMLPAVIPTSSLTCELRFFLMAERRVQFGWMRYVYNDEISSICFRVRRYQSSLEQ